MTKDIMGGISPLPWTVSSVSKYVWADFGKSSGEVVCFPGANADRKGGCNAAYIVHACNLYPELVEALERLTMMAEGVPLKALDTVIWTQDARAILAKCKAGSE